MTYEILSYGVQGKARKKEASGSSEESCACAYHGQMVFRVKFIVDSYMVVRKEKRREDELSV